MSDYEIANAKERALELRIHASRDVGLSPSGMLLLADHFEQLYEEIEELKKKPDQITAIGIKWMKRADIYRAALVTVGSYLVGNKHIDGIVANALKEAEAIAI